MDRGLVGMLGDWQAGPLSAPPGRHQRAAVLLLSELCSGPLCHTYICTWPSTHTHTRTHLKMGMDTHKCMQRYTRTQTHSSFFFLAHTHTHFLSLCYGPAVKSQLNNESPALLPLCIEAEELVIACTEQYMCVLFSQLQHGQPTWGNVSWGSEKIQACLPSSV